MALHGLRVLVTRPPAQAEGLCRAIEAAGGHALRQPLLDIEAPSDPELARERLAAASEAGLAIFTSANAVAWAMRLEPDWSPAGRLAAVGRATAEAMAAHDLGPVLVPERDYSSEGLLQRPELAGPIVGRAALITGEGGRRLLADTLRERGAQMIEAAVYRRVRVPVPRHRLSAVLAESDVLVVTSGEALSHLVAITPPALAGSLYARQLVVPSERVLQLARRLGFQRHPLRPDRMDDAALVAALERWLAAGGGT